MAAATLVAVRRLFCCSMFAALAACSESPDVLYTLRLDRYDRSDPPTPLHISNETLLLPLTRGETVRYLSRAAPGDLLLAYTRISCSVGDPNPHLTRSDIDLPSGPEVRLIEIEIDEIATEFDDLSGDTCFAVRADGVWSLQFAATSVAHGEDTKTSTFVFDHGSVDAVAIFFPLYADVTEIRYRIADD